MIRHLALIMDGNRRWARKRGMLTFMGHKEGAQVINRIVAYCLQKGIEHLSLYTFSIENLKRTQEEKTYLFDLLAQCAREYAKQFAEQGVRIRFVGDRALFPASILSVCEGVEEQTALADKLHLNLLFCYGGQQEIVAASKACMRLMKEELLQEDELTVDTFRSLLWSGHSPAPEIIVRTGGVTRLSNFLLFSCAYSELFFTDTLWPDFSVDEMSQIMQRYENIKRNFGS